MTWWGLCKGVRGLAVSTTALASLLTAIPAFSDTLEGSLVLAYQNNPTLNAQRASVRATDEGVPQALAGYRPRVTVNGAVGSQYTDSLTRSAAFAATYTQLSGTRTPTKDRLTATKAMLQGFRPRNAPRQAESPVKA